VLDRAYAENTKEGFMKTRQIILILVALAVAVLLGVGAYMMSQPRNNPTTPRNTDTSSNTSNPDATNPNSSDNNSNNSQTTYPVNVYFSKHPESDNDPSQTFPVNRTSPNAETGRFVIEQLLAGPTSSEKSVGYFSTVRVRDTPSNCNNKDFTLAIANSTATLRFCRTFDALGTVSDGQAEESITDSLMQFSTVKKVIILTPEGHCQFDMSGEDRCLQ
jgi:hypothetical protein